jgi:Dolichyl-phosphate-mannose-protein mannosyltransferase
MSSCLEAKFHRFYCYVSDAGLLWPIIAISLILNLWGIRWGAPASWHPDEITDRTIAMIADRSINPHHFAYGGLHYYVLGFGAVLPVYGLSVVFDPPPPKSDALARERWWQPRFVSMVVVARSISAILSTAVVFLTYLMGRILFDKQAGYLAALLLSISMSFVAVAHFATVDSPANFWYWLSCLFSLLIWKRGDWRWYVLAAVSAGFAIGTKFDRLLVLLPLAMAIFLRGERIQVRKVFVLVCIIAASYLLANPAIFTSFFEFADGFTRDLFYNALRQGGEGSSHEQVLQQLLAGLGLPLFAAAACGLAYVLWELARGKNVAAVIWLLTTVLPYFFLFGSSGVQEWYIPFFLPALMVLAARAWVDWLTAFSEQRAYLPKTVLVGVILYSFLYTVCLNLQFSNDSRYTAAKWLDTNVSRNATIALGERGPSLSKDKYRIVYSKRDEGQMDYALENRQNLERHSLYKRVRESILGFEAWTRHVFGFPIREKPYAAWFDIERARQLVPSESPSSVEADYVVLVEDLHPQKIQNLMASGSQHRIAARFHFVDFFGIEPRFPFVNPPVYIFQRIRSD